VLRVYTSEPHEFDSFEVNLVQAIAAEAAAAIVSARLYEEAVNSANMRRALHMAGEVQRRMIPTRLPSVPGVEIGAIYVPTFELSGDFYDFIDLPPDNVGVAVCDVAGKGVRASLLMAALRAYLRAHAANIYDMSTVLSRVNQNLCADILSSDFATLFYGVLDYRTRRFTYSNAGHLPPILFRGGRSCYLDTGGTILGLDPQSRYKFDSFQLQAGDVILAYTDGLPDALNFADEPFGRRRAESAAAAAIGQNQSAEGIARHVLWEMRRFSGLQTRLDDLTIVAIRVL
jgi:sigma-B regulation protein RsbU (phosphoserine phosphatase)